ncbi:MAG: hypothetical protein IJP89_02470 [Synergistaceae bacterium]|nr:hypothetical protein [Synergistaceae bacterium]
MPAIKIFLDGKTDYIIQNIAEAHCLPMEDIAIEACKEILHISMRNINIPVQCRQSVQQGKRFFPLNLCIPPATLKALKERAKANVIPLARYIYFACWHYAQVHGHEQS